MTNRDPKIEKIETLLDKLGNTAVESFHYVALFIIGCMVIWSAGHTVFEILTIKQFATIDDILLLFIYLELGAMVGIVMARHRVPAKRLLLSLMTLPLSFPGVIVGFFIILLGGRQGLLAQITQDLGLGRVTFAYGLLGLFLAYLYFSLPRAIATYTAAAESIDRNLEEAARACGASRWAVARDVWIPELAPTSLSCGAIVFATSMGAFGTAFTLSSRYEVLPITIYNEFTNYANFTLAASLSISLGLLTWFTLWMARRLVRDPSVIA